MQKQRLCHHSDCSRSSSSLLLLLLLLQLLLFLSRLPPFAPQPTRVSGNALSTRNLVWTEGRSRRTVRSGRRLWRPRIRQACAHWIRRRSRAERAEGAAKRGRVGWLETKAKRKRRKTKRKKKRRYSALCVVPGIALLQPSYCCCGYCYCYYPLRPHLVLLRKLS